MPEFTTLTPSRPLRRVLPVLLALPLAPPAFVFFEVAFRALFAGNALAEFLRETVATDLFATLRGEAFLLAAGFFFLGVFLFAISEVYHRP
jgi:hypothetical protein